jgi:hypothetical protein
MRLIVSRIQEETRDLPRTPFVAFIKSGPSISVVHSVKLAISILGFLSTLSTALANRMGEGLERGRGGDVHGPKHSS